MRFLTSIFIILILLSGCSGESSLELISSSVEVRNDRSGEIGITSGDKAVETIQPISLSYDFVLKNIGKETLGGMEKTNIQTYEYDDGIKLYIEPRQKLKAVTKEIMGFNIYDEEEREQARLGMGKTSIPVIEPNQEGEYTLDFDLGALEENPEMSLAPPQEQIEKLVGSAMDATLVIYIEDEEIARFNLNNSN